MTVFPFVREPSAYRTELDGVPLTVLARIELGTPPTHYDEGDPPECEIVSVLVGEVAITDLLSVAQLDRIEFNLIDAAVDASRKARATARRFA
jgi:hypothetical protein